MKSFTTQFVGANGSTVSTTTFKNLTSVANDGQGDVFVLDAGVPTIYIFSGINGSNPSFRQSIALQNKTYPLNPVFTGLPVGTAPTVIFYAGGVLWAALPNHTLAYLAVNNEGAFDIAVNSQSGLYPVISLDGTDVTGATFDGQFVWFTTKQGVLFQVQAPQHRNAITGSQFTAPVVVNVVNEKIPSLTPPIFDGSAVWTSTGGSLVRLDVQYAQPQLINIAGLSSNVFFDGIYLWMQASGQLLKYDPVKGQIIPAWSLDNSSANVAFTGSTVAVYGSNGLGLYRSCDGFKLGGAAGNILGATFDGSRLWMVAGSSLLVF